MVKAAIFDMDGTVLNTAEDLKNAMNYAMREAGLRHDYTEDEVKTFFGSGMEVAVQRALAGQGLQDKVFQEKEREVCSIFAGYYPAHSDEHTAPYAGIPQVLKRLRAERIRTAVVSNKMDAAVQKLVRELFPDMFDFAIGEQSGIRRKPAPDMTNEAMERLGVSRENAVYIGDSEVDMQTAENSGLPCISVTWGFRPENFLRKNGARHIVTDTEQLYHAVLSLLNDFY